MDYNNLFVFDSLSKLVAYFVVFFSILIAVYSIGFIKEKRLTFYFWILLTALASLGAVFSRHIVLIAVFWGFLGLSLFKLINLYDDEEASQVAKKTFIIIGASDAILLFGLLLYSFLTSSKYITGNILIISTPITLLSFLCIAIGCFAKSGCMPFHTWVPQVAQKAPIPVVAYLPASLDKLLGVYLLIRIVKDSFLLDTTAKMILIILGAVTIIFAVMMALIQHDIKKLLGYHAVSQVGYMVLGIGCATNLGIAAGLFHMINNSLYKCSLFLTAGNIEKKAGSTDLDKLGGLGKFMPITFTAVLIASFSISGIPPFNGFVSKWMIYQGLSDFMNSSVLVWQKTLIALSLVCALVGSGLTLASFLKLACGAFLGNQKKETKEAGILLLVSPIILSLACVIFGIFAYSTILPQIEKSIGSFTITGLWQPTMATGLMVTGIIAGLIIFKFTSSKIRTSQTYTGGEPLNPKEEVKLEDFYATIQEIPLLKKIYALAQEKVFDIYEQFKKAALFVTNILKQLHNGVLPTYFAWCLIGMLGLFFLLFR